MFLTDQADKSVTQHLITTYSRYLPQRALQGLRSRSWKAWLSPSQDMSQIGLDGQLAQQRWPAGRGPTAGRRGGGRAA